MKNRALFVCNTVYQVLVALWIQHHLRNNQLADFIISNHMSCGDEIADRLRSSMVADKVYFVESYNYSYKGTDPEKNRKIRFNPKAELNKYVRLSNKYGEIYIANCDRFARLLCNSIAHNQFKKPQIILFEDGIGTYSKAFERNYKYCDIPDTNGLKKYLLCYFVYKDFKIYDNLSKTIVFDPDNMRWNSGIVEKLDKIDSNDLEFKTLINSVFNYDGISEFKTKYIFIEESFYADGTEVNDVELIEQLAKRVGKENITVKIHPRNPINRFAERGFKTNKNLGLPWEVEVMNNPDLTEKVFITIASSSVLNMIRIFDRKIKAYSLYNLMDENMLKKTSLYGELGNTSVEMMTKYPQMMIICDSLEEIE